MASKFLQPMSTGPGFAFNYQPSRIDRNALFALNSVFCKEKISEVRTKYHRAKLNLEDVREDLMEFGSFKTPRKHSSIYHAIIESVDKDVFGDCGKVVPSTRGAVAAYDDLPRQKSCGLPYKLQGFRTKKEALEDPRVIREIRAEWYAIEKGEDIILPDVACYARAQICNREKNKVRATWGYPLSVYLTEGQYFYPLLKVLKQRKQPTIAYGIEIGTGGMTYIDSMCMGHKGKNILVGDWSKFDFRRFHFLEE